MIPRVMHSIWIHSSPDDLPSDFLEACRAQTVSIHPEWAVADWHSHDILQDPAFDPIRSDLDACWARFAGLPTAKSDLMRLAVLYLFGGVYCDHDVWAIRPFDDLLPGRELILAGDRMDPPLVGEHVMGASPRHPFIWKVLTTFLRSQPNGAGRYSPKLTKFAIESGIRLPSGEYMHDGPLEVMAPAVFCPAPRIVESEDEAYQVWPRTRALHCWSRFPNAPDGSPGPDVRYDLDRLRDIEVPELVTP